MAQTVICPICGEEAMAGSHLECRVAELEDLVFETKRELIVMRQACAISGALADRFERCSCQPLSMFLEERKIKMARAEEKRAWLVAKGEFVRRASEDASTIFTKANPDPDPLQL